MIGREGTQPGNNPKVFADRPDACMEIHRAQEKVRAAQAAGCSRNAVAWQVSSGGECPESFVKRTAGGGAFARWQCEPRWTTLIQRS